MKKNKRLSELLAERQGKYLHKRLRELTKWQLPQDQVRDALKVLAPAPHDRAAAQEDIEEVFTVIGLTYDIASSQQIKPRRKTTIQLLTALQRAAAAAQTAARVDYQWALFPIKLDADIERCKKYLGTLTNTNGPPRRNAYKQHFVVSEAYDLIFKFGNPKQLRLTRHKTWHQLSAILYGDPKIDLFNHMRRISRGERHEGYSSIILNEYLTYHLD